MRSYDFCKNAIEISCIVGLELTDTTTDVSGYPRDLMYVVNGFESESDLEAFVKETHNRFEVYLLSRRDGQVIPTRRYFGNRTWLNQMESYDNDQYIIFEKGSTVCVDDLRNDYFKNIEGELNGNDDINDKWEQLINAVSCLDELHFVCVRYDQIPKRFEILEKRVVRYHDDDVTSYELCAAPVKEYLHDDD